MFFHVFSFKWDIYTISIYFCTRMCYILCYKKYVNDTEHQMFLPGLKMLLIFLGSLTQIFEKILGEIR